MDLKTMYKTATDVYMIPVKNLSVDPDIQRKLDMRRATKMSDNWDELLVGVLIGILRDDVVWITDGQHRAKAAELRFGPRHRLPILVHNPATARDGARQFLGMNKERKAISKMDEHRVALTAEEPLSMAIQTVLDERGLEIAVSSSANRIGCVGALYRMAQRDGGATVTIADALDTTIAVWGRGMEAFDADILQAVAEVFRINRGSELNVGRLQRILGSKSPLMWKATVTGGSHSRSMAIARALVRGYNQKLRISPRLVEPPNAGGQ